MATSLIDLCSDFFLLGIQVSSSSGELPDITVLRERLLGLFDTFEKSARSLGFTPADIDNARYALAAYLDEMVQFSDWSQKQDWAREPLQVTLYGEQVAGIKFFERLEQVKRRSSAVLEVYYCCLALGFSGQYRMGSGEKLRELLDAVRHDVTKKAPASLSQHAHAGPRRAALVKQFPLLWVAAGSLVLALIVCGILLLLLAGDRDQAHALLSGLRV